MTTLHSEIRDARNQHDSSPLLVTGRIGAGKTTACYEALAQLRQEDEVGGVLSPRIMKGDSTTGYQIHLLSSDTLIPFATQNPPGLVVGKYYIDRDALQAANEELGRAAKSSSILFVDEVGPLELSGRGLAAGTRIALKSTAVTVLLTRNKFIKRLQEEFDVESYRQFDLD